MQGKILKTENPWIEHLPEWVKTATGQNVSLFRNVHKTLANPDMRPYLFIGGVHGDEPEGVKLAEDFLLWLKSHSMDEDHPWILIPCLNVEGYRANQRTNGRGVDLNRNFPSRDWVSSNEKNRYYPGETAGSEPEVQALVKLIHDIKPRIIVHFHSWKPCVVFTGEPGKPYAEILTRGNDYECHADIGYPTPGSLGQYGWLEHKIPVICIEEKEHSALENVWPHFREGLIALVKGEIG